MTGNAPDATTQDTLVLPHVSCVHAADQTLSVNAALCPLCALQRTMSILVNQAVNKACLMVSCFMSTEYVHRLFHVRAVALQAEGAPVAPEPTWTFESKFKALTNNGASLWPTIPMQEIPIVWNQVSTEATMIRRIREFALRAGTQ